MNKIGMILKDIRNHVDPTTGEVFNNEELEDPDVRDAIIDLVFLSGMNPNVKKNPSQNLLNRPVKRIFEELKSWRLDVARQIGLPAYCVFSDAELRSIAEGDIVLKQDLLRVKGISFTRYDLYGDDIYNILKPYIESDIKPSPTVKNAPPQKSFEVTGEKNNEELQTSIQSIPTDDFTRETSSDDTLPSTKTSSDEEFDVLDEATIEAIANSLRVKENCQHSKGYRCFEVRPNCRSCKEFRILPEILEEERKNWPQIGYATWIRLFGNYFRGG